MLHRNVGQVARFHRMQLSLSSGVYGYGGQRSQFARTMCGAKARKKSGRGIPLN